MILYFDYCQENETIAFAVNEFSNYLSAIGNTFTTIHNLENKEDVSKGIKMVFCLEEKTSFLEDSYEICIKKEGGYVKASNPRSILLAVYAILRKIGFRFLTPTKNGTKVPKNVKEEDIFMEMKQTASFPHRGVCIEGSESIENVLDFIDWLPKVGYNSFFVQFLEPFTFLNRWYDHINNPLIEKENRSKEFYQECYKKIEREVKRRSLILHTVGHGWTAKALGYPAEGWTVVDTEPTEEIRPLLAEEKGVRKLNGRVPLNTNLCYSNKVAQERFAEGVISYIKTNPGADYVHIWLADDMNHMCECENCRDVAPSDHYVQLLNLIDEKMEEENLDAHLVFLLYQELLYAPIKERLKNQDRFTLMFAPITRTFLKSYPKERKEVPLPEYKRNQMNLPIGIDEYLMYLQTWQDGFKGDSFVYDYPLGRSHYGDLGYVGISKIIAEDIHHLSDIGLNGYISCQELRAAFPNSMPNYVMGHLLFDKTLTYEEIEEEYFKGAYGTEWKLALDYVHAISRYSNCDYFNGKGPRIQETLHQNFTLLFEQAKKFQPEIKKTYEKLKDIKTESETVVFFWKLLVYYTEYAKLLGEGLMHLSEGKNEEADSVYAKFCKLVRQNELEFQPYLDVYRLVEIGVCFAGFKRP